MPRGNPSPKLAITIDPEVHEKTKAREALHRRAGLAAVADWERQYGPLTPDEMNEARRRVREVSFTTAVCWLPRTATNDRLFRHPAGRK